MKIRFILISILIILLPILVSCGVETNPSIQPESSSPPTSEQPPSSTPDTSSPDTSSPDTTQTPDDNSQTSTPSTGEDYKFTGVIESIGTDTWVIGGQTLKVDQNTELDSGLSIGVTAKVEYIILGDGTKLALEIETP